MTLTKEARIRVGYLEQKLTSFKFQFEKLEQYLESPSINPVNANLRLEVLSPLYEGASRYSEELTSLQADNPELAVFQGIEMRYFEAATRIKILQRDEPRHNASSNAANLTVGARQDLPRFPEIRLPVFDGKRENWASFKNKFITLVDSRSDASDAVKCTMLFSSLTGSALAKIEQFEPSAENYANAWKTLLDFYDHKRVVAKEHLDAILDLPRFTSRASAADLTRLLDIIRPNLHILESLGARSSDEHLLVRIIERCLPPAVRSRWQDKLKMNEFPKLSDLLDFLQTSILKQQEFEGPNESTQNSSRKRSGEGTFQPARKMAKGSAHALMTSSNPKSASPSRNSMVCPMCQNPHRLYKCPEFLALKVQERWDFVRRIKACQNCLWDHPFTCGSDKRCRQCHREHHTLLHNDRPGQQLQSGESTSHSNPA